MDTSELLIRLKKIDPKALEDAHDELIGGFDKDGQPISLGDPVFEMDGERHRVPFQQLRDVLQGTEPDGQKPVQEVFRGRIPKLPETNMLDSALRGASAGSDDDFSPDGDYYWDKNYNYEYMHPDAEKQRVLGKIKK